jgi:hypothetical protein
MYNQNENHSTVAEPSASAAQVFMLTVYTRTKKQTGWLGQPLSPTGSSGSDVMSF